MRLLLAAALAGLTAAPALAQSAPAAPVTEKLSLQFTKPDVLLKAISGKGVMPEGIQGILGYPLDNSLLVRGDAETVRTVIRAVRVGDVPIALLGDGRATASVRPDRVKPEQLRDRLRQTPGSERVSLDGARVVLEGKADWVRSAVLEAVISELRPAPAEAAPSGSGFGPVTLTFPAGADVKVESSSVQVDSRTGEITAEGPVVLRGPGGVLLRAESARVRVVRSEDGTTTVTLLPRGEAAPPKE